MYYVYVLQSQKDNKLYIGYTKDLKKRFSEHNEGKVRSTIKRKPFSLIYYEAYKSQNDAMQREFRLKRYGKGLAMLKKRIGDSLKA